MPVQVGILGFAHGHVNAYLDSWRENPSLGALPVAGWDHDAARMAEAAKLHNLSICPTPQDLLSRQEIGAVVIAAETSLHADLVEKAAQAGKAIVLQKPMALTMPEADRIVAAVERAGTAFTMAWQMRVDPQNLQMREMVASGALGKVYSLRRRHGLGLHVNPSFATSWHLDPAKNRDIWADDAAHAIDFIYWMLGQPQSVTAELATVANDWMPNDNGVAVFGYPDGPLAEVCCSFTCLAAENTTEIYAERGVVIQSFGDSPGCAAPRPEGLSGLKWYDVESKTWTYSDIPSPAAHWERILGLAEPLADFVNGRREPIATAAEGRAVLQMVLACYVSSRDGRRVRLDDPAIAGV